MCNSLGRAEGYSQSVLEMISSGPKTRKVGHAWNFSILLMTAAAAIGVNSLLCVTHHSPFASSDDFENWSY